MYRYAIIGLTILFICLGGTTCTARKPLPEPVAVRPCADKIEEDRYVAVESRVLHLGGYILVVMDTKDKNKFLAVLSTPSLIERDYHTEAISWSEMIDYGICLMDKEHVFLRMFTLKHQPTPSGEQG